MSVFSNNAITDVGRLMLAKVHAGGIFEATRIVMGSGTIPAGKTAATMTEVAAPVVSMPVIEISRSNDGMVTYGAAYSNKNIETSFYFRELALFARVKYLDESGAASYDEEVLYSYGNAGDTADLMPAYTEAVVERHLDLVTWVGNETMVVLEVEDGVTIPARQKGQPGGVAAIDDAGNIEAAGKTVVNLGTPVNPGDAVPKSYADTKLPLAGGMMTGPINMNMQPVQNLPAPSGDGDAVSFEYAEKHYGAPPNLLRNSNFAHPVNRQGLTSYNVEGIFIDNWGVSNSQLSITLADGYIRFRSEYDSDTYIAQELAKNTLVAGKTYTAAVWLNNGAVVLSSFTPNPGDTLTGQDAGYGIIFELLMGTYLDGRLSIYFTSRTVADIKHLALFEGKYTRENLPAYPVAGHELELLRTTGPKGFRSTIPVTGWTQQASGFYRVTVSLKGILEQDRPFYDIDYSGLLAANAGAVEDAFAAISQLYALDGSYYVEAHAIPPVPIPICLEVYR